MYIAHIQWKYFHMRITNAEKKISQLKAILKKYALRAVLKDVRFCFFFNSAGRLFHSLGAATERLGHQVSW